MLLHLLAQHKDRVLTRWYEYVLESYPAETRKFLKSQKNRFSNPVGASIAEGLEGLYDGLTQGTEITSESMTEFLDKLVRIRAVQEFSPSQALQFIFLLKNAIRQTLKQDLAETSVLQELLTVESRIDNLALLSFDLYVQCREKLFEIRLHEIRDSTARTWERICRKYGITDEPSESRDDDSTLR